MKFTITVLTALSSFGSALFTTSNKMLDWTSTMTNTEGTTTQTTTLGLDLGATFDMPMGWNYDSKFFAT